jgi:hypothetical protein
MTTTSDAGRLRVPPPVIIVAEFDPAATHPQRARSSVVMPTFRSQYGAERRTAFAPAPHPPRRATVSTRTAVPTARGPLSLQRQRRDQVLLSRDIVEHRRGPPPPCGVNLAQPQSARRITRKTTCRNSSRRPPSNSRSPLARAKATGRCRRSSGTQTPRGEVARLRGRLVLITFKRHLERAQSRPAARRCPARGRSAGGG